MRVADGWFGGLSVILVLACSSGSGSAPGGAGGAGGGSVSCSSICSTIQAVGCPNDGNCVAQCEATLSDIASPCQPAYSSLLGCMSKQPLVCGPDGEATLQGGNQVIYSACGSQAQKAAACAACAPAPNDDQCDSCEKTQCCQDLQALANDPSITSYLQCTQTNGTAACLSQYPSIQQRVNAVLACRTSKCSGSC